MADNPPTSSTRVSLTGTSFSAPAVLPSPKCCCTAALPAYKGIPLATATVDKLAELDERRFRKVGYSFNRKEAKDHGDGRVKVGTPLRGQRVVIIDKIITAETADREAIEIIKA